MNSSNVVETPNSDIDRPSSVDCHDSEDDCNSTTSTSDSDSRYLLPASIIAPHAHRADSRIPMSHSTAEDYANAIRSSNNVFGSTKQTNSIRNLSHNTIKYTKSLTIIESRFFESLVENETLSSLASFDNDPDNGNQPIRRFYLICRGLRRNATKDIINTAVLWFATKFFKKKSPLILESASDEAIATAMYQPNTAQTKLKDLFRCFSRQGIPYSLSKDFNGEGEIQAFFKKIWQLLPSTGHWNMATSPWHHSSIKTRTGSYEHSKCSLTLIMMIASSPWYGKWAKRSVLEVQLKCAI